MKEKDSIINIAAITYLILIITIHFGVSAWGDIKIAQLNNDHTAIVSVDTGDKKLNNAIRPYQDMGNNAYKTLFKIGVFAASNFITIAALIIPNLAKSAIDEWVNSKGYIDIDWSVLNKYFILAALINTILFVMDSLSAFEIASIYYSLIYG